MFKYSVKIRVFEIQSCTLPIQIDASLPRRGSYSMNKGLKMRRAIKTVWKGDIRMDGMQAIFSTKQKKKKKSTHPTQSNVKVHSMSILTGPHDRKVGYRGPPFMLHFEFWWCRRWRSGGREKGAKKPKKKQNMGTWLWISTTFIDWGKGERRWVPSFPPPPESYTYMGDGRATVQQDTLVSIGNRCHNTFHLHLHTGREKVEMRVFWSSVLMVDEGGEQKLRLKALLFSSYKIKKIPCGPKRCIFIENRDAVIGRFFTLSSDCENAQSTLQLPHQTQETKTHEKLNNLWILKFEG